MPHLLAAAAVAERGWATREVVDLYSLAAELADDERERASIRLRRGIALKALDADHEAAAELAAVVPSLDGTERLDGLLYAGRAEVWCERHEEALDYAEQALAYAEELGDPDGRAAALGLISDALAMRGDAGDLDRALALGDEALAALAHGRARLRARRSPPPAVGRQVLDGRLRRLGALRQPRAARSPATFGARTSSSAAAGWTRWRASGWGSTRSRSRSSPR